MVSGKLKGAATSCGGTGAGRGRTKSGCAVVQFYEGACLALGGVERGRHTLQGRQGEGRPGASSSSEPCPYVPYPMRSERSGML